MQGRRDVSERVVALRQRACLLSAVWADARRGAPSVLATMMPRHLLPALPDGPDGLDDYAAKIVRSPDGVCRVARDHVGGHPGAPLLQAPVLAVFLPGLCRALLGQTLLLPSMPVWWLGDRATRSLLSAHPDRFCFRDGFDPDAAPIPLAGLPPFDRLRLQGMVDVAPQRYVLSLGMASTPLPDSPCRSYCSMRINFLPSGTIVS